MLVEPSAERWVGLTHANHARLSAQDFPVLDLSSREVRCLVRDSAGIARDKLAVVSGHEPELVHPGVLAKHIMTDRVAAAVSGAAINLIVDHDSPKHTKIDVPVQANGRLAVDSLRYAEAPRGRAWEVMPPMSSDGWGIFEGALRNRLGERFDGSMLPTFLTAARGMKEPLDWVDQWAAGRRAVEAQLDVRVTDIRAGRLWVGPLLAEMVVNAPRFSAAYNAALAEHRRVERVRSPQRPIPDLAIEDDRVEVPAWAYRRGEPRRRLFVRSRADGVELFGDREPLGTLPRRVLAQWETAAPALGALGEIMFRPRALTLTLWARLFLADLFVHGIGGAKYDRITDAIIRTYFGVEPPAMSCVSATLLLDLPRPEPPRYPLGVAQRRWRDVHWNPQRYVAPEGESASLLRERERAVARSDSLRAEGPQDHDGRRRVFSSIRALNEHILAGSPAVLGRIQAELQQAELHANEEQVAGRRDYFFGLFTQPALETLLDRLPLGA